MRLTIGSANARATESDAHETELRIDIENELAASLTSFNTEITAGEKSFDSEVLVNGTSKNKTRALKDFSNFSKYAGSTDRLEHEQYLSQHSLLQKGYSTPAQTTHLGLKLTMGRKIVLSDPIAIASLICIGNDFRLFIGEVNGLRIDGQSVDYVSLKCLEKKPSYQMLGVRPAALAEDPEGSNDWRTYTIDERSFTVPGRLVQSINPETSKAVLSMPFYLLQSIVLVALTASLFQSLTLADLKNVPKLTLSKEYPYREVSGQ